MIIDFHTHVFPREWRETPSALFGDEPAFRSLYDSPNARLAGVKDLLRNMDEQGIQRSVIFGFPWEKSEHFRRHNDYILEAVNKHPSRLTGFCCFSPLSEQGSQEAERCLKSGLSGVGELSVYDRDFSSEVIDCLKEVSSLCRRFDAPVLLHTNEPVGHQYPGKAPITLRRLYDLVKAYPGNRIVLAHWGGGLFFYALMKKEVREVLQNVWFDTAASPFLYTPEVYRVGGEIVGFDRILLGSDFPLLKPGRYIEEMKECGLSPQAMDAILGGNAARLLKGT